MYFIENQLYVGGCFLLNNRMGGGGKLLKYNYLWCYEMLKIYFANKIVLFQLRIS